MIVSSYGKQIRTLEEAVAEPGVWVHFGYDVTPVDMAIGKPTSEELLMVRAAIMLGTCWDIKPGCARHLRAIQTMAELRAMSDWKFSAVFWCIRMQEDGSFARYKAHESEAFSEFIKIRFESLESCQAAIDKIGQDRLREVLEAGESL